MHGRFVYFSLIYLHHYALMGIYFILELKSSSTLSNCLISLAIGSPFSCSSAPLTYSHHHGGVIVLVVPYFMPLQDDPGLSLIFPVSALESAILQEALFPFIGALY